MSVGDLPQPVAHGVRVHEERAGGRLERRAVLEVRRQRLDQGAPAPAQRQVDLLDQVPAGVAVAGQRPLGQQVVGWPPGAARPASRRAARSPDSAARAETWAEARSSARGPTTTGPSPK